LGLSQRESTQKRGRKWLLTFWTDLSYNGKHCSSDSDNGPIMFDSCKNKCICTVVGKKHLQFTEGFEAIVLIFIVFFALVIFLLILMTLIGDNMIKF
jgi:hypothetical protein